MAYSYEINTEYSFPNITLYNWLRDGVLVGYRINANEGYVFYDTNDNYTETDPETGEERPVTYYHTVATLNPRYNFDNFSYIAVPRDSVDENYIFGGGGNNDHEVM